uniref:Uncharacterized protein n=1 Tax=Fagus sylvatica TaxID=28930 RepID=A0A2N9FEZ5_FAGSY
MFSNVNKSQESASHINAYTCLPGPRGGSIPQVELEAVQFVDVVPRLAEANLQLVKAELQLVGVVLGLVKVVA